MKNQIEYYQVIKSSVVYSFSEYIEVKELIVLNALFNEDDDKLKFEVCKTCYLNGKFFHNLFHATFGDFKNALSVYHSCVHDSEFDCKISNKLSNLPL